MKDRFGREIDYLRISVTDRCNLRCLYCMPGDIETVPMREILTFEEIVTIVHCASRLGISKIKITGGEPLVRRDVCKLIKMLKAVPGIDQVTLTTNGLLLDEMINDLVSAGTDCINISLDTLDSERYRLITGYDRLDSVIKGLESALKHNIMVRINAVSVNWDKYFGNGIIDKETIDKVISGKETIDKVISGKESIGKETGIPDDIRALIGLSEKYPVDVRFIELMPIGSGKDYQALPHDVLIPMIQESFPGMEKDSYHGNGPAVYYHINGYTGRIGFISAIHGKFCDSCNRIRLTSRGYMKSCLCYDKGVDLKDILRGEASESQSEEKLLEGIKDCILSKPDSHSFLNRDGITEKHAMSAIGG